MPVEIRNLNINVKINYDKQESETTEVNQVKTRSHEKMIEAILETLKNRKER